MSNFTFLRGASHPQELVERAAALGYSALAVTDECSVAGVVRAHSAAKQAGIHLIVGTELWLNDGTHVVLLAENRHGYGALCRIITRARRRSDKGHYELDRADLEGGVPDCAVLWVPDAARADDWPATAQWLKAHFAGQAWVAVELLLSGRDTQLLQRLQQLGRQHGLLLVAAGNVHMHRRQRRPLQDTLTAIRLNRPLDHVRGRLFANGERHLRSRQRLTQLYPPELLAATQTIANRCTFSLDELRYEYPDEIVPADATPTSHLRALTWAGARQRWPQGVVQATRAQIEHELALIAEIGYEPYFLTVHDIVAFARSRGILCQGRGSAANSAVCYCLGITELDPGRSNLLFERFISKERGEPPDIDVDFEHHRREEVIQYIYGKYGRERAALAATLITYRTRSAVRDVGKALGLDALQTERLAKAFRRRQDEEEMAARLREAGFDPDSSVIRHLLALVHMLIGFPRHLSQHVGGFVISRGPLAELVPIENAAMPERTIIQWDKDDLDAVGLLKIDVLALGMLTVLRDTLERVNCLRGGRLTLAGIPAEDPAVYGMLRRADTIGLFQIESRAQMSMLPRLRPATFYDLVIQIAIVRPGPIQGDMVHPYLARRSGQTPVTYPSPAIKKVLQRTLGVPIFQEQVMALAVTAAGFTPGEADQLRRSMGVWRRNGSLAPFQQKLMQGLRAHGCSERFAEQIYNQIEGFGEYGFPESHSASFALLAYASAWLKHYEPAAYLCAMLDAQPMGFYAPAQLVSDARRHNVDVRPVDVSCSAIICTLETKKGARQPAVRLGLNRVKGLSARAMQSLLAARGQQPFASLADVAKRAGLDQGDMQALAAADALKTLSGHRYRSSWQAMGVEADTALALPPAGEVEPLLEAPGEAADIVADYAHTGLTLGRHPLALLRHRLERQHVKTAAQARRVGNGRPVRVAGLVTHRQQPGGGRIVFVTLEDESGYTNIIVRDGVAERDRQALLDAKLLVVAGIVQCEGDVFHVVAGKLMDYSRWVGELAYRSRDFR